ncbi:MAG: flavodoxin family protein [Candidatus Omnitrophica bacterium]|nr:flavodoxin family protein [Candidatus Omnitrophota bacterium]
MQILISYYSRGGHTKQMAELIREGLQKEKVETDLLPVDQVEPEDLLKYDGIIVGSPTYYGVCAAEIKALFDKSVAFHGKLDGKLGGAFSSAANVGGGNETTVLSILQMMLIHGMVVQGDWKGDHYGPVSVGEVDDRARENCVRFAQRFARRARRI